MISASAALTKQFYDWERRGRGWHAVGFSCDLEPPFVPFFGHFFGPGEIIDDAKRPSFFGSLLSGIASSDERLNTVEPEGPVGHPYSYPSGSLTVYSVTLPKQFKQSKERITQLLVMLSYRKCPISFELIATEEEILLEFVTQDSGATFFYAQLQAFFPECTVLETYTDRVFDIIQEARCLYTVDFGLSDEFMRPLAAFTSNDHDPYLPLFGVLERIEGHEAVIIQILFCGVHNAWAESIQTAVSDDSGKASFFFDAPEMPQLAREKVSQILYGVTIRAVTVSETMEQAAALLQQVATTIVHASTSTSNSLLPIPGEQYGVNVRLADILLRETHRVGMLLNAAELATFVHFPAIHTKKLIPNNRTTKLAPRSLTGNNYVLGINEHQRTEQEVSILTEQRLRHLHISGATGTGKSTLLKSLIMQDVIEGIGLMCLDPHGDLIEDILYNIPEDRIQDVVLIDPHDAEFPVGLNILVAHSDIEKELLASDLVAVFRRFSTSWGDAMNSVFANAILAFLYNSKQYHLGDLRRFLIEAPFRAAILATVTDPDIVYYWQAEYPILKSNSIGSILTRLDAFLRPKSIRNMLCQTQSLDVAKLMDTKKIVLVKLSQGLLGAENSYLLGAFIVSKLQQTAMARQAQGAKDRIPFFCYIDEFQYFITPSMASILSGARKYGLGLVLSHQDMSQVAKYDAEIAASVLANAATRICFRLGDTDAKRLEDGFSAFSADDLQNLAIGEAIARVNTRDADFNLSVIPYEPADETNFVAEIIKHSRKTYSVSIAPTAAPNSVPEKPVVQRQPQEKPATVLPVQTVSNVPVPKPKHSREHRALQVLIKGLAEGHGYRANIEVPTPDGTGLVDVLLEKGEETIAIEISVTTRAVWELHNIRKCLAAGYGRILVVANTSSKRAAIIQQITSQLSPVEQLHIQVVPSDAIQTIFTAASAPPPAKTIVNGYEVKIVREPNPNRQDLLQSIINAGKRR